MVVSRTYVDYYVISNHWNAEDTCYPSCVKKKKRKAKTKKSSTVKTIICNQQLYYTHKQIKSDKARCMVSIMTSA